MKIRIPSSLRDEVDVLGNGEIINLEMWVSSQGDLKLAVAYAALFWPDFVQVGKYIFRNEPSPDAIAGFELQSNNDSKAVEAALNHVHLVDFHLQDVDQSPADQLFFLGTKMKEMYEARLKQLFPDSPCVVDFYVPKKREEIWDYQLTFWQKHWDDADTSSQ